MLQSNATAKPTHGNVLISKNKYKVESKTIIKEIILLLLSFSLKKIYPKKTLSNGKIK